MSKTKVKKITSVRARSRLMTQSQLAVAAGIPQGAISAIEKGSIKLGAERAEKLARALEVHPAVLLWPTWEETETARAVGA